MLVGEKGTPVTMGFVHNNRPRLIKVRLLRDQLFAVSSSSPALLPGRPSSPFLGRPLDVREGNTFSNPPLFPASGRPSSPSFGRPLDAGPSNQPYVQQQGITRHSGSGLNSNRRALSKSLSDFDAAKHIPNFDPYDLSRSIAPLGFTLDAGRTIDSSGGTGGGVETGEVRYGVGVILQETSGCLRVRSIVPGSVAESADVILSPIFFLLNAHDKCRSQLGMRFWK